MGTRRWFFTIVIMTVFTIAGCGGKALIDQGTADLEKNWGRSLEMALYNQTLNPEAGQSLDPVEGLEGPAAEVVMGKYRASFAGESKKESYTLNLGNISGIGEAK